MVGDTELKKMESAIFRAQKGPCGHMVGDTELLGGFYVSKKIYVYISENNNPSKFRNSEEAATPKIAQLLGLKTGQGITRTPYNGFLRNVHP